MTKILLLLALAIVISCSPESKNEEENNNPANGNNLVKREYVSDNYNIEYRYNENDLLTRITDVLLEEDIDDVETYKYDQNNNVIEKHFKSNNSSYESITDYHYDNQNRLTEIIREVFGNNPRMVTLKLSYSGNIVTIQSGGESEITLEMNNSGLVQKLNDSYSDSFFEYDSNGNMNGIATFDKEGNLLHSHTYTFDNKKNPFYGQLKSLYIPLFLTEMSDLFFGEVITLPYMGYNFPFLKNNITSFGGREYQYNYNNSNLPITVIEKWNDTNEVSFQFDIEYFE